MKYNEEAYKKYNTYKIHCYKLDTSSKCKTRNLNSMLKAGSYSSETNI